MNYSPADILGRFLVDQGYFPAATFPLFVNSLPDRTGVPDSCAAIYDTEGNKDGRLMDNGVNILHQGVQLRVRHADVSKAYDKVHTVATFLSTLKNQGVEVASGTTYTVLNVSQVSPPLFLGSEDGTKRRSHFTVNFLVTLS